VKRINRISYRSSVITPDLAAVLRELEVRAVNLGNITIQYDGPSPNLDWEGFTAKPGATGYPAYLSLLPAGREISLRVQLETWQGSEGAKKQAELTALWGLAVPLGLVPWNRYPLPGPGDDVFHYLGPWRGLYDHLCGEGRGELAWPSVVCAAQVDVGAWEGDRLTERFVQAQLHRLGAHCGPVDGIIGDRTLSAVRALGVQGLPLDELAAHLGDLEFSPQGEGRPSRKIGHVILPGWEVVASAYGDIHATHVPQGVALTVDGPGRVVLDVRLPEGVL
jgi:hypothetical protein